MDKDKLSQNVFVATKLLWNSAKHNQKYAMEESLSISKKSWLKEFCLIKVGCTRSSGHTYTIREMSNFFENSIILIPNFNMLEHAKEDYKSNNIKNNYKMTTCDSNLYKIRGIIQTDSIFVDCSYSVSNNKLEEIESIASEYADIRRLSKKPFGLFLMQ